MLKSNIADPIGREIHQIMLDAMSKKPEEMEGYCTREDAIVSIESLVTDIVTKLNETTSLPSTLITVDGPSPIETLTFEGYVLPIVKGDKIRAYILKADIRYVPVLKENGPGTDWLPGYMPRKEFKEKNDLGKLGISY